MGREMGGRFKREGIYVHLWLIYVDTERLFEFPEPYSKFPLAVYFT